MEVLEFVTAHAIPSLLHSRVLLFVVDIWVWQFLGVGASRCVAWYLVVPCSLSSMFQQLLTSFLAPHLQQPKYVPRHLLGINSLWFEGKLSPLKITLGEIWTKAYFFNTFWAFCILRKHG